MAREHAVRDTRKEACWLQRFADWRKSGLSGNAYCAREGLSPSTFRWWKRELMRRGKWQDAGPLSAKRENRPKPADLPFLPVVVVSASRPDLKLVISGRYRVEIPPGFDTVSLAQLLTILDSRRC